MGTRIIGPRPWLGPGMAGGSGTVDEHGNPVDPYGGPTTGGVMGGHSWRGGWYRAAGER